MTHLPPERIALYVMGGLPTSELERVESHLAGCNQCQRALQAELALEVDLQAWGEQAPPLPSSPIRSWAWVAAALVLLGVGVALLVQLSPAPASTPPTAGLAESLTLPSAGLTAGRDARATPCLEDCRIARP